MDYIIWLVATVIFAVIEMCTVNLVTIWFALGALVTFKVSFFTDSYMIEMWVFIITTIISLIITKPLVKNKLEAKKESTADYLTESGKKIVNGGDKYIVKFKLLEIYEELRDKLEF